MFGCLKKKKTIPKDEDGVRKSVTARDLKLVADENEKLALAQSNR